MKNEPTVDGERFALQLFACGINYAKTNPRTGMKKDMKIPHAEVL